MKAFSDDDLRRIDRAFAEQGVPFHARPLKAAQIILGGLYFGPHDDNSGQSKVTEAYERLFPECRSIWPGKAVGFAASVDQVRRITVSVVYGTVQMTPHEAAGFQSHDEWVRWCRYDNAIAACCCFAVADLYDFAYPSLASQPDELTRGKWRLARSNLEDVASILAIGSSTSSVVQPICMAAELAMKGALNYVGISDSVLKSREFGHDHAALAKRLVEEAPHEDDELVLSAANEMPSYVASRYEDAGLTRLRVVELALRAQFLVASAIRRFSTESMSRQMAEDEWPGPRAQYFGLS